MREAEARLRGAPVGDAGASLAEAGRLAGAATDAVTDLHGSAEYKQHLVAVLLRRAFAEALAAFDQRERRSPRRGGPGEEREAPPRDE
jgi:CO/xanthine dehydrogenase FAD-binding subunit